MSGPALGVKPAAGRGPLAGDLLLLGTIGFILAITGMIS
jgi:hypothetical protein